jgi:hypothetical protein
MIGKDIPHSTGTFTVLEAMGNHGGRVRTQSVEMGEKTGNKR